MKKIRILELMAMDSGKARLFWKVQTRTLFFFWSDDVSYWDEDAARDRAKGLIKILKHKTKIIYV